MVLVVKIPKPCYQGRQPSATLKLITRRYPNKLLVRITDALNESEC